MKTAAKKLLKSIKTTSNFEERLKSLKVETAENVQNIFNKFLKGSYFRKTRGTNLNEISSRSHCVFSVHMKVDLEGFNNKSEYCFSFSRFGRFRKNL